jgi:hypothetical protein
MARKILLTVVLLVGAWFGYDLSGSVQWQNEAAPTTGSELQSVIADRQSDTQVQGTGTVTRVLSDDNDGSRHQRFILRLATGESLLVAHNIDLAPRVKGLQVGDTVSFNGEYEWNDRGGVIHWTHHDPRGSHVGGWVEHNGRRYE